MSDLAILLKEKLDEIDRQLYESCYQNYFISRKNILLAQWKKGELISAVFRGVKTAPSYRELSKQTQRSDTSIKQWHEIYKNNTWEQWEQKAEEKAHNWTQLAIEKAFGKPKEIEPPPMIDGVYRIIYADPPWQYNDELIEGKKDSSTYGAQIHHFPPMSIESLCEMGLPKTNDNAVLFLWVTSAIKPDDAHAIVNAWGFEYKAKFIWDKVKHNYGNYNSVRHEELWICTKGSCVPDVPKLFDSIQTIERTNEHSEKPEEFREIIDTLYPIGNRIELFARKKTDGWDSWGNEV